MYVSILIFVSKQMFQFFYYYFMFLCKLKNFKNLARKIHPPKILNQMSLLCTVVLILYYGNGDSTAKKLSMVKSIED